MTAPPSKARLVVDWDGTVTDRDTLALVIERFGDLALYRRTGERMGRTMTHDEALALSFRSVTAPLGDVVKWLLSNVRVRPGLRELAERHRPLIVSSGLHELIEPVLSREGVAAQLLANRVDAFPSGWRIAFRDERRCDVCGEPCKRASLPPGDVVYVGDGYSDRCAALAAGRIFARASLAADLEARGVPYEPFGDLDDVLTALDAPPAVRA